MKERLFCLRSFYKTALKKSFRKQIKQSLVVEQLRSRWIIVYESRECVWVSREWGLTCGRRTGLKDAWVESSNCWDWWFTVNQLRWRGCCLRSCSSPQQLQQFRKTFPCLKCQSSPEDAHLDFAFISPSAAFYPFYLLM